MKKATVLVLCLLFLVIMAGCAGQAPAQTALAENEDTAPSPTLSEQPASSSPPDSASPEAEEDAEEDAQVSTGTGEMKTVDFYDVTFTYNDKYEFEENDEAKVITIRYEPKKAYTQIFYLEEDLSQDEEEKAMLLTTVHDAFLSSFYDTQMVETDVTEVAGIPALSTSALVRTKNSSWLHYVLYTVPTDEGIISFAYFMNSDNMPEGDYLPEFIEMANSLIIIS